MFQHCQGQFVGRFHAHVPLVFGIVDSVQQIQLTVLIGLSLFMSSGINRNQPATGAAVFLAFYERKVLAVNLSICLAVEQNVLSTSLKWDISIK